MIERDKDVTLFPERNLKKGIACEEVFARLKAMNLPPHPFDASIPAKKLADAIEADLVDRFVKGCLSPGAKK